MMNKNKLNIVLTVVLIFSLVLRIWGINFGLPQLFHFDERFLPYNAFYTITHYGSLHFAMFYGNLIPFLLGIFYAVYYVILKIIGVVSTPFSFLVLSLHDPTNTYLIGRIFFALCSTLTILVLYLLCKKIYNNKIALLSSILLGICFLPIQQAKFMKGDTIGTLFLLLAFYSFYNNQQKERLIKKYVLPGIFLGLTIAARFTLWIAPLSLMIICLSEKNLKIKKRINNCLVTAAVAVITFLVCTPSIIFNFHGFLREMGWVSAISNWQNVDTGGIPVWIFYLVKYLPGGIGWPLEIIAICGILFSFYKRENIGLISFPLLFWMVTLVHPLQYERYLIPVIPFLVMFASGIIYRTISKLKTTEFLNNIIFVFLTIGLVMPNFVKAVKYNYLISRPDTRKIASNFIESSILPGSKIVCESGDEGPEKTSHLGPQLRKSKIQLEEQLKVLEKQGNTGGYIKALVESQDEPTYNLENVLILEKEDYTKKKCYNDISIYVEKRTEYLITSSWARNQYACDDLPEGFYSSLESDYELVKEFKPYPVFEWDYYSWRVDYKALSRVRLYDKNVIGGPVIRIYKIKNMPTRESLRE